MPETKQELHPIRFLPSKLALIAPDISLQKYLQIGLRPSLRKPDEFRPISISNAGLSRYDTLQKSSQLILGSSIVKCGPTTVICTISAGIVEDLGELTNDYHFKLDKDIVDQEVEDYQAKVGANKEHEVKNASVYTIVDISRGRTGPPTNEEMDLSQSLYETILQSGLIKKDSLKVKLGLKSKDANGKTTIIKQGSDDILEEFMPKKSFNYVLYAKMQVYSRVSQLFDICYGALISALKNTKLPEMYMNEKDTNTKMTSMISRKRNGSKGHGFESDIVDYDILCDPKSSYPLRIEIDKLSWSSTFALINPELKDEEGDQQMSDTIMLADPEGVAEEHINQTIKVISGKSNHLMGVTIHGGLGDAEPLVTTNAIHQAVEASNSRAKTMIDTL